MLGPSLSVRFVISRAVSLDQACVTARHCPSEQIYPNMRPCLATQTTAEHSIAACATAACPGARRPIQPNCCTTAAPQVTTDQQIVFRMTRDNRGRSAGPIKLSAPSDQVPAVVPFAPSAHAKTFGSGRLRARHGRSPFTPPSARSMHATQQRCISLCPCRLMIAYASDLPYFVGQSCFPRHPPPPPGVGHG